jgi:hypothetical protein
MRSTRGMRQSEGLIGNSRLKSGARFGSRTGSVEARAKTNSACAEREMKARIEMAMCAWILHTVTLQTGV